MSNSPCHSGNVKVFEYGKAVFYAGGWSRGMSPKKDAIMIDLTGEKYASENGKQKVRVHDVASRTVFSEVIDSASHNACKFWLTLEIKDFGIPTWGLQTWELLADVLRQQMDAGVDVVIGCVGGHGRTGIAVSILAHLMGVIPEGEIDPIAWVRKVYCDHVVETPEQVNYIYDMTIPDLPADKRSKSSRQNSAAGSKHVDPESLCEVCHHPKLEKGMKLLGIRACKSCIDDQERRIEERYPEKAPQHCVACEKNQNINENNLKLCADCISTQRTKHEGWTEMSAKGEASTTASIVNETSATSAADRIADNLQQMGLPIKKGPKKLYIMNCPHKECDERVDMTAFVVGEKKMEGPLFCATCGGEITGRAEQFINNVKHMKKNGTI